MTPNLNEGRVGQEAASSVLPTRQSKFASRDRSTSSLCITLGEVFGWETQR